MSLSPKEYLRRLWPWGAMAVNHVSCLPAASHLTASVRGVFNRWRHRCGKERVPALSSFLSILGLLIRRLGKAATP
jgi:hypothetical protein